MKKIIVFTILASIFVSCGGGDLSTSAFCDGDILIPFQEKKGKDWGLIDINGNVVIEPEFDLRPSFAINGIALVRDKSSKDNQTYYRFVKIQDGKAVESDDKWDFAGEFKEGLAPVRNKNEKVQFINENFEVVFTAEAEEVSYFNDGLAHFSDKDGKWGFIDKSGKEVIKPQYDRVVTGFRDGKAIIANDTKDGVEYKVIDQSGNVVLNLKDKYENVYSISSDLVKVQDEGEWGFIDLEGNVVVKLNDEWSFLSDFMNGYATFREDREWGLIDITGNKIFKAKYEEPLVCVDGKIWYKEDGEWGLMDLEGNDIIKADFDGSSMPYPFMCATTIVQDGEDYMFIDAEGKPINQEEYESMGRFDPMYITGEPWNGTFESDYFDVGSVKALIASDLIKIKDANSFAQKFELDPRLFWGKYNRSYRQIDGKYQFYDSYSMSYSFDAYQYDYSKDYKKEASEYEAEAAAEEMVEALEEAMEEAYYEEGEYYEAEAPEEKIESKYPLDAPSGVNSINYKFSFDDYLGVTSKMSMDAANEYYQKPTSEKKLDLNKDAKVRSIQLSVSLNKKGDDKAAFVAKAIADMWKGSMKNIEEEDKENSYSLKADLPDGEISIRTRGGSRVTVEVRFNNETE